MTDLTDAPVPFDDGDHLDPTRPDEFSRDELELHKAKRASRGKNPVEIGERRAQVYRLIKERWSYKQIAAALGVSVGTVASDAKAALKVFQQQQADFAAFHFGVNLERLQANYAWLEKVKDDAEVPIGAKLEASRQQQQIMAQEAELLGHNAPRRLAIQALIEQDVTLHVGHELNKLPPDVVREIYEGKTIGQQLDAIKRLTGIDLSDKMVRLSNDELLPADDFRVRVRRLEPGRPPPGEPVEAVVEGESTEASGTTAGPKTTEAGDASADRVAGAVDRGEASRSLVQDSESAHPAGGRPSDGAGASDADACPDADDPRW